MQKFIFRLFVCIGSISLICLSAQADFSGSWQGTGKVKDALEKEIACPIIKLSVQQSAESLQIKDGEFKCTPLEMQWSLPQFQISSNELYFQNTKIGNITFHRIKFDFKNPNEKLLKKIELVLEENQLSYHEYWINEGSNSAFMEFKGKLTSAGNF